MKNMTANPATSPAHLSSYDDELRCELLSRGSETDLPRVLASWVIVLLKEMYLKSFTHEKNTQMATADLNIVPR